MTSTKTVTMMLCSDMPCSKALLRGLVPVEFEINYIYNTLVVIDANNDGKLDVLLRHVVPETFGWNDQTVEYTLLENVSE